jgi:hypothetical protein
LIAARWQAHPACAEGKTLDAAGCLALIRHEPMVTRQAVAEDDRLKLVYTSFVPDRGRSSMTSSLLACGDACDEETKSTEDPPFAVEGGLRLV